MSERQTMDFFEHQDQARSRTRLLLLLFSLALLCTMLAVYLIIILIKPLADLNSTPSIAAMEPFVWWQPRLFLYSMAGVFIVVGGGTLYKLSELSGGGKSVAELLGATPVPADAKDEHLKRYRNVVEEMAIASGTPIPLIYAIPREKGINAFAAGFTPRDAAVCVTGGTLENLSRDELQGVVAHEFSHIVNGDMRLNTRLMGVLHGILAIGLTGYFLLRSGRHSRNKSSGGIAILGLGLLIVGYLGVFFARLIKAAVSRQREFLADASAVQFTRNPSGIAGALAKIAGLSAHGRVLSSHAEEASHLFFVNALSDYFISAMATHPPLEERIRRISPGFELKAKPPRPEEPEPTAGEKQAAAVWGSLGATAGFAGEAVPTPAASQEALTGFAPEEAQDAVGTLTPELMAAAQRIMASMPPALSDAAREPFGARAVILCLLTDQDPDVRKSQLRELSLGVDPLLSAEISRLMPAADALSRNQRLPLADLAVASLTELSKSQYLEFAALVESLSKADNRLSVFEFLVAAMVKRRLAPVFGMEKHFARPRFRKPGEIRDEIGVILSCLAWYGTDDSALARNAFERGISKLNLKGTDGLSSARPEDLSAFSYALSRAAQAYPALKKQILAACSACVFADRKVTADEAELLRAVSDSLDCPMPLVLADE
ncbi:MAG: M48 family metallopeptidase [Thermodesulfobacteriota bacterium]